MDLSPGTEEYIKESIEISLGLPVSVESLSLKLLATEDARRRLQDQIFVLEDRLKESSKRLEQSRAESNMNAQGVRRCVEEKEVIASQYADLVNHCRKLEEECSLYERDLERIMETCDELAKENEEMRAQLQDISSVRTEQGTSCSARRSSPKGMVVSETSSGKNVKRKVTLIGRISRRDKSHVVIRVVKNKRCIAEIVLVGDRGPGLSPILVNGWTKVKCQGSELKIGDGRGPTMYWQRPYVEKS
ncbi:hypothetical protein B296_00020598 [Ensete ventricosum]|uniref:Uncharacterized protein n=1 Tax=Ensete ventricosum TaxID=4639 RepID=A0A427ADL2_ENSVE|nr:hypothetical protein B296_00020598 [Ensete ventricosum]